MTSPALGIAYSFWLRLCWVPARQFDSTVSLAPFCRCANNARVMASQQIRTAQSLPEPATVPTNLRPSPPPPPSLPLFRFGLRQLFWSVTAVSVLLDAMVASPAGMSPLSLLLAALVVTAHVAGTAIGSRLRLHADQARAWESLHGISDRSAPDAAARSCDLSAAVLPPPSPWHRRGSTSLGWLPKLVIAGAIVGGFGGVALFLTEAIGRHASLAGIAVGAVSLAVLGGWFAFLSGSFYAIFRHGLRDAMAQQKIDESRKSFHR